MNKQNSIIKAYLQTFINYKENNYVYLFLLTKFTYKNNKYANIKYIFFKFNY